VPRQHLAAVGTPATVRSVVFPRYVPDAPAVMAPRSRAASLVDLARNTFNFGVLGEAGFDRLGDLVSGSACFDFSYSQLDDAVRSFEKLALPS
jgi:hypothetical protein